LLVLDWWPLRRFPNSSAPATSLARLALEKWPFFLLSAGSCGVTFLAQRTAAVLSLAQYPLLSRLGNALLSYARYVLKTAWPADLAVIYPLPAQPSWLAVAAAGSGLALLSWLLWRARRGQPYLWVGWLWYLGTLVPVIGFVQAGQQAMADRYTYFPTIGIVLAAVLGARDLAARFRFRGLPLAIGTGLILAGAAGLTEHQLSYWDSDESLFAHAVAVTRDNPIAQIDLGLALEQQGRQTEALAHYQTALRLAPGSAEAHNDLANLLDDAGQTHAALGHYQAALRLNPNAPLAHCNLATLLVKLGRFEEARQEYLEAARLQPDNPHPYYLLGKALLRQGLSTEAIRQFRHALELDPNDFQSLAFLARILATDENPKNRDGQAAVGLAEQANRLTGGSQPFVLDVLAMAYAEAGRFNEAQHTAGKAQDLAAAANRSDLVAGIHQHLQLYQTGLPCREAFTNALPNPAK
jgi:tetratricopeptide (TPR) repeat protein